ncbi:MAG: hypothetical protein OEY89_04030 [Gammaproteobacteria bacterium]|nr:hypothetical protein [Gammaproteobacteria bacterium]
MKTIQSLDSNGYRFCLDGGLVGIVSMTLLGLLIELIEVYIPVLEPICAPIGTLAVGFLFGMMFCRVVPIWMKEE